MPTHTGLRYEVAKGIQEGRKKRVAKKSKHIPTARLVACSCICIILLDNTSHKNAAEELLFLFSSLLFLVLSFIMKPEPHGIDDKFILRPQLAKQLKINAFFTTMPATTWRMMHDMVANHVKYEEGLSGAEESYKMFKTAFQAIGEKSTYKALATYCKSLSAYYVSIKIIAAYEHEVKEYDAQQEALRLHDLYKNGVSLGAEEINRMRYNFDDD